MSAISDLFVRHTPANRLPAVPESTRWTLQGVLSLLEEPTCILRLDGRIALANRAFKRHFGLVDQDLAQGAPEQLLGCTPRQFERLRDVAFRSREMTVVPLELANWLGKEPICFEAALLPDVQLDGQPVAMMRMRIQGELVRRCLELSNQLDAVVEQERDAHRKRLELESEALALRDVVTELEASAHKDALTTLPNRAAFDQHLERVVRDGFRERQPLTVILFDLDDFKQVNDSWGHPTGDDCLRRVAAAVAPFARRPMDLVARLGGEEFALLLPDCDRRDGQERAAAIRRALAAAAIPHPTAPMGSVTASIGVVSTVPASAIQGSWFYHQADRAQYKAKQAGKDRVHCAR